MTRRAVQPPLHLVVPVLPAEVRSQLRTHIEADWAGRAACASRQVDPDWWHAPAGDPAEVAARTVCGTCPVRRSCLAHSLAANEPYGIWGGFDEVERVWLRLALAEGTRVATVRDVVTRTAAA
jgi:hypothetical protein